MASYMQVTPRNVKEIHKANGEHHGAFLISKIETNHFLIGPDRATLELIRKATLDPKDKYGPCLNVEGDLEPNREYRFSPQPDKLPANAPRHAIEWEQAGEFFEKLKVGKYQFQINSLSLTSTPLFRDKGRVLFIPRWSVQAFAETITNTLYEIVDTVNATAKKNKTLPTGLGPNEVKTLVDYIMDDIRTGRVLAHNVKAGKNADDYLGM